MTEPKKSDPFHDLDWATLEDWAGTKTLSRGKQYQCDGQVRDLVRSANGAVVAWVDGTRRYATAVYFEDGLVSECTCPVGVSCKHAVAVVLEYLALCEKKIAVPSLPAGDSRYILLPGIWPETGPAQVPHGTPTQPVPAHSSFPDAGPGNTRITAFPLRKYLEKMKKDDLINLIHEIMEEFPEVEQEISDRRAVAGSDAGPIFEALLADIDDMTQEEVWSNTWTGESQVTDYSPVLKRMEILLAMGKPEMVVEAGGILLKKGTAQIETGSDEAGETDAEIASCMDIVFAALMKSSRPAHERMLFAIHAELDDEFGLCEGAEDFLDKTWPATGWSLVADSLLHELDTYRIAPANDNFSEKYHRNRFTGWIVTALDNAGRESEATDLCVAEVEQTNNYVRLVRRLIRLGQSDEAVRWILQGIEPARKISRGIAHELKIIQREIWESEGDWLHVAGFRAGEFLCDPSHGTYCTLKSAAEKTCMGDVVEEHVIQYLTSGSVPSVKRDGIAKGPLIFSALPDSGLFDQGLWKIQNAPFFTILIDRAMANHQPEEAVMWFDRLRKERTGSRWDFYPEDKLWDATADRFPERALRFWMESAEQQAGTAQPKGYENAIRYLRKIHALMEKQGRNEEWVTYLAGVRDKHIRKKKFLGMLEVMEGKKIMKS
jgi:uncharacterized Zn finger protein